MKNKLIAFLFIGLLSSCSLSKPLQESVIIGQNETIFPVIIRGNLDEKSIIQANDITVFSTDENMVLQSGKTVEMNSAEKSNLF